MSHDLGASVRFGEFESPPVRLRVWGPRACFTRPDLKAERYTYDVITPSAARGIFDAIHWNPGMRWRVDRIWVERPLRYLEVRRTEVRHVISAKYAEAARKRGDTRGVALDAADDRQQRGATVLRDVSYLLEGRIVLADAKDEASLLRHQAIFRRRARKGQCYLQPYLGVREFPAAFELAEHARATPPELVGEHDLGWMLLDAGHVAPPAPAFFHAIMRNGLIDVRAGRPQDGRF